MKENPIESYFSSRSICRLDGIRSTCCGHEMTQAECDTLWNQANPSGAATITQAQAQPYVTDFKAANLDGDNSLDQKEFATACKNGLVKGMGSSGAASGDPSDKMAPAEKMAPKILSGSKY